MAANLNRDEHTYRRYQDAYQRGDGDKQIDLAGVLSVMICH